MKKSWLISWVCLLAVACNDPYENTTFLVNDSSPTAAYLEAHAESFSEWVSILHYTNMFNALNQADLIFTSFVPDNAAVKAFYSQKGVESIEGLGEAYAQELVRYHVVPSGIPAERFTEGYAVYASTYSGDRLVINFREGGAGAIYVNDIAHLTQIPDTVVNGYIYVLDAVLPPMVETISDRVSNDSRYAIFKEALNETGWLSRLSVPYDTTFNNFGGFVLTKKNFTVLAVADDVFQANGINNLAALKSHLGASTTDYTATTNPLWQYVAYHIISGSLFAEDMNHFETNDTMKLLSTNEGGSVLAITRTGGEFFLNYEGEQLQLVDARSNQELKNGVIHEVDGLMEMWTPDPVIVDWDLCNFPDIAEIVNKTNPAIYHNVDGTEYKVAFTPEAVTSYTWTGNATKTSTSTWPVLGLATEKTGSINGGNYGAMFHDMLSVNVGYLGSFETKTPVIIKGQYKVELFFGYGTSLNTFRANGSKCQFSFDGTPKEALMYKTVTTNAVGLFSVVIAEMIEFEATAAHAFKLVVMDPLASTNSDYRLQLDYIKFTPIK
ncbi:MAG: DUF5108 domain-containing protein [Odoribacteraceae bacterium]|nr:DUF5108 domain-containing protein [Odoribacteraceae bacterium]